MTEKTEKRIGIIVGRDRDWSQSFIDAVNAYSESVTAELVVLGGTFINEPCPYDLIVDRQSHDIPYYRAYLKYALLRGTYIINNPMTWSADSKFFGTAFSEKLGLKSPRAVVLPNKEVDKDVVPDSFRNLQYPMAWDEIIEYVGLPAILKDIYTGGRPAVYRVHNFDEMMELYDGSGTRTMVLQELITAENHFHCFVMGQKHVLPLNYVISERRYLPTRISKDDALGQELMKNALKITRAYGFDVNMVELALKDDDLYIVDGSNPAPAISKSLMTDEQFQWCIDKMVDVTIDRAFNPISQNTFFKLG